MEGIYICEPLEPNADGVTDFRDVRLSGFILGYVGGRGAGNYVVRAFTGCTVPAIWEMADALDPAIHNVYEASHLNSGWVALAGLAHPDEYV